MTETHYRVIKRHADDYIAIDYPDITSLESAIQGITHQTLADGETITIAREVAPNAHPNRFLAWDRAVKANRTIHLGG
jgi:hypothetical protein